MASLDELGLDANANRVSNLTCLALYFIGLPKAYS